MRTGRIVSWMILAVAIAAGPLPAQVPPEIATKLIAIGRGVCVPETAELYAPLQPKPPYAGVKFTRNISFGPDVKNVLDVAEPETGGGSRPVLIYLSGGAGNKQQGGPNGAPFYDNIMVWAVKSGMVGVNMQRRSGKAWDDPAKDVSLVVQWVNKNIAQHKGNPKRVFAWSQSAGNIPLSTYVAHSEFWGTEGIGLKGVIFMSPPAFDILPIMPPGVQGAAFAPCGSPNGGRPATPATARGGGPGGRRFAGGRRTPPDPATQLARSNLPGLTDSTIPFMISVAELDPPTIVAFAETLRDALRKANRNVTFAVYKHHSHISEVMSPDTADKSVTGPILKWIKSVK